MMLMGWVVMQIAMPNRQGLVGAENLLFDYFPMQNFLYVCNSLIISTSLKFAFYARDKWGTRF